MSGTVSRGFGVFCMTAGGISYGLGVPTSAVGKVFRGGGHNNDSLVGLDLGAKAMDEFGDFLKGFGKILMISGACFIAAPTVLPLITRRFSNGGIAQPNQAESVKKASDASKKRFQ